MFKAIHSRLNREDRGFTLIELMVVVLIIAILIAIAIPTFLGARKKAQDRAAQADLRQAVLTAKSYYTDTESFGAGATFDDEAATATAYAGLEPSQTWVSGTPAAGQTSVEEVTQTAVLLVKLSKSGTWFGISDSTTGPTKYCSGAAEMTTIASCTGTSW